MTDKVYNNIDINSLTITDIIDIELLQKFQDNFAESMDIASITVDRNGKPVTRESSYTHFCKKLIQRSAIGNECCSKSHRKGGEEAVKLGKPYIYTCHAGLIDFAAPILVEGKLIGTILGGQVLTKSPEEKIYRKKAKEIGIDEDEIIDSVNKIKITKEKNIKAAAEVLFVIANALSKIGYEELKLKKISQGLENEVLRKDTLIEEYCEHNKLKTQLFSIISHELKTPIHIIYSTLQLLDSMKSSNNSQKIMENFFKYSGIMKQNCHRLIRLINNVIDINKIELGYYNLNLQNNNIVKILEDITLSVVEFASLKNINIIFDTDVEEKIIALDVEKLERIILNLLSNSIKFTNPEGQIKVSMFDKKEFIIISVKDTGIGIPEEMLDKIFGAFVQVDSSLRRNNEGSGIGLSLVKSLVNMLEGTIKVNSKLGRGSEFLITLPVRLVESNSSSTIQENNDINGKVENIKIEFSDIYL